MLIFIAIDIIFTAYVSFPDSDNISLDYLICDNNVVQNLIGTNLAENKIIQNLVNSLTNEIKLKEDLDINRNNWIFRSANILTLVELVNNCGQYTKKLKEKNQDKSDLYAVHTYFNRENEIDVRSPRNYVFTGFVESILNNLINKQGDDITVSESENTYSIMKTNETSYMVLESYNTPENNEIVKYSIKLITEDSEDEVYKKSVYKKSISYKEWYKRKKHFYYDLPLKAFISFYNDSLSTYILNKDKYGFKITNGEISYVDFNEIRQALEKRYCKVAIYSN